MESLIGIKLSLSYSSPEKGLPLMHALSQAEMSYFSRLPIDRAETVLIGLSAISSHLELDSRDARQTISQLFINYQKWDRSSTGQQAWSPLLLSLKGYLDGDAPPSQELLDRVAQIRACLQYAI